MIFVRNLMYAVIGFLFFSVIFPPFFSLVNRIEPWVLGLPFLQFWLLLFGLGVSAAMLVLWKVDKMIEEKGEK